MMPLSSCHTCLFIFSWEYQVWYIYVHGSDADGLHWRLSRGRSAWLGNSFITETKGALPSIVNAHREEEDDLLPALPSSLPCRPGHSRATRWIYTSMDLWPAMASLRHASSGLELARILQDAMLRRAGAGWEREEDGHQMKLLGVQLKGLSRIRESL